MLLRFPRDPINHAMASLQYAINHNACHGTVCIAITSHSVASHHMHHGAREGLGTPVCSVARARASTPPTAVTIRVRSVLVFAKVKLMLVSIVNHITCFMWFLVRRPPGSKGPSAWPGGAGPQPGWPFVPSTRSAPPRRMA